MPLYYNATKEVTKISTLKVVGTFIKSVNGRNLIEFDKGAFDSWCVYLTRQGKHRYAPTDKEYLAIIKRFGLVHGAGRIYADFLEVYNLTTGSTDPMVLSLITDLCAKYPTDAEELEIWFTVVYAGMVAEENKANAKLKKRIKRLAMHQILVEGIEPEVAASFSKGKEWRVLDRLMKSKGF